MTKGRLIELLTPFTDDIELYIEGYDGTRPLNEKRLNYVLFDGDARIEIRQPLSEDEQ